MNLKEFFKKRAAEAGELERFYSRLAAWKSAVTSLLERFRSRARGHDGVELIDWSVLRREGTTRYNLNALSIHFLDMQITIEPDPLSAPDTPGIVRVSCGERLVTLANTSGDSWTYTWRIPEGEADEPLTDEAIDEIIQGLLS